MENNKENRLGMFQKVHGYLLAHTTETAAIAAVATQLALLDTHITNIFTYAAIADAEDDHADAADDHENDGADLHKGKPEFKLAIGRDGDEIHHGHDDKCDEH